MPFLKFEERNDVFGKTALFSLKIFSNREKEIIVLIDDIKDRLFYVFFILV